MASGSKIRLSSGRPKGTTADKGYATGVGGGRTSGTTPREGVKHENSAKAQIMHDPKCKEDEGWCTDEHLVNVSPAKLKKLKALFTKECKYDSTPLGKAVCWQCGRILYGNVGNGRTASNKHD